MYLRERRLNELLQKKRKKEEQTGVNETAIEMPISDVTPELIQKLTSKNLQLKKKLLLSMNMDDIEDYQNIMHQIESNDKFIMHIFDYDRSIRDHIEDEPSAEKHSHNDIKEDLISDLKNLKPRQGRMDL